MAKKDITMFRGTTKTIIVTQKDGSGQPLDYAGGDKVVFSVKQKIEDGTKALEKIVTAFAGNEAAITLDPKDTANLAGGKYTYDIILVKQSGEVYALLDPSTLTMSVTVADGDYSAV